jgi:type IV pilus assembly protein PilA
MLRSRLRADEGFTLVELLVVMLILAILVAISLPSLLGQKTKAQDTHAKTSVVTASKAALAYGTDHGSYNALTKRDLFKIEPSLQRARNLTVDADAKTFTVSVSSPAAAGAAYSIERTAAGDLIRDCTLPGTGGCREDADEHGDRW